MSHRLYECNACSYAIFADEAARAPAWCPICRSLMSPAGGESAPEGADYACPECGYAFRVPRGSAPAYKCAACNYTFPSQPNKRVDHKL